MRRRYLLCLLLGAALLAGAFSFAEWRAERIARARYERMVAAARAAARKDLERKLARTVRNYDGKAGIVIKDMTSGWEYSHNKSLEVPSASVVKVAIMAAVYRAAAEGRIRLDQEVTLRNADKLTGSGTLKTERAGTKYTVARLVELMIGESDNTATNMLTSLLGIDYLNKAFVSFGLKHTDLARRVADYTARDKKGLENYTTAGDIAGLIERMYRGRFMNKEVSARCIETLKLTKSTNRIPRYLPDGITVAHKTGLESGVCHDAGVVYTPHGDFLIVVLVKHHDRTAAAAKAFIGRVSEIAYDYFTRAWTAGEETGVP